MNRPAGSTAVMASRREPPDSLDDFPTPPWATRALLEHVLFGHFDLPPHALGSVWEPACNRGLMAEPLREYFGEVHASDIFPYGYGAAADFLDEREPLRPFDWIVTNPPFKRGLEFALRALPLARRGVAMFVRTQWIEGAERYRKLFRPQPPHVFAPFVERVALCKGRWDPDGSTATSYAWFVWLTDRPADRWETVLFPPCKAAMTRPDDIRRFAVGSPTPLFDSDRG